MRSLLVLLLAVPALYGCIGSEVRRSDDRLAGACQVRRCLCGPEGWSSFMASGVEVLWRENGDAYCPEGYTLHVVEPAPRQ
jgi:hypothetical protein